MLVAGRHPSGPLLEGEPTTAPFPLVLLRSFSQVAPEDFAVENGFEDPFAKMDVDDQGLFEGQAFEGPGSDSDIIASSQAWVEAVVRTVGLPEGGPPGPAGEVAYSVTRARSGEGVYQAFWRQAAELMASDENVRSGSTLVCPFFATHNAGGFEYFANTLNSALSDLNLDLDVQLIFFHPQFSDEDFEDSEDVKRCVEFARCSPFPMVTLLRTAHVLQSRNAGAPVGRSLEARTLIEIHERLCGPEGGLIVDRPF